MNKLALLVLKGRALSDWFVKIHALSILRTGGRIQCAECGCHVWDQLHLDHKDGAGYKHRRELGKGGRGAGMRTYRWVIRHPDEARHLLQLLCANCHQLKTRYGFVPIQADNKGENVCQ